MTSFSKGSPPINACVAATSSDGIWDAPIFWGAPGIKIYR
jgi:hypothetical protein